MTSGRPAARSLALRAPVAADAGWIATEIARPEVQRMLSTPPHPYQLQHARAWIAAQAVAPGAFVIEERGAGPAGVVSILPADDGMELGYWLRRSAWGRGLMTEAAAFVLDWHFGRGGARVVSGHYLDNPASARVLAKLGFTRTRVVLRHSHYRGVAAPLQRLELTAARWHRLSRDAGSRIAAESREETEEI